jgi:uncharacterized membrane protein HdeD (DUF308 family)
MVANPRVASEINPRDAGTPGWRAADMQVRSLARNWWAVALRGVAAVIFGVLAFALPAITLASLVLLFGAYALVEGVFSLIAAMRRRTAEERPWWALLLEALVSIAAGIVTFVYPGITALALVYVIGAWAVVTGVLEIVTAVRLRERIRGEGWLIASGILSVVFGALVMVFPGAGALAMVLWIGAYAVVFGGLLIGLAFRLRRWTAEERPARVSRAA